MFGVLIIDDEEIIREGLIKTIPWEAMSCQVVGEAADGDEGLALIESLKPDIVFTDIRMPGIDGLTMISKIRERKKDCMIIIITGHRNFEYAQEAVRLGAFRFLLKPVKTEDILAAIQQAIENVKMKRSAEEELHLMRKKVREYYGLHEPPAHTGEQSGDISGSSSYLVHMALAYMRENYARNIDLKTLSDKLFVSTWHLSKLLRKETGSTFVDLLNSIRVEEAKKLLSNPAYKIYAVAEAVGFADVPYFTKLFKKLTGMTPMEYKNRFSRSVKEL